MHKPLTLAVTLAALAACTSDPLSPENPSENFGQAVRSNMAAQIIAKEGEVDILGPAPGVRRSLAVRRYQTDQVEQPVELYTRAE